MTNIVNYFEVGTPDPATARSFYGELFGWQIGPPSPEGQYANVEDGKGGLWDTSGMGGESWAIFYVQVDDVAATVAAAERAGAKVAVPLVDAGELEFAHLLDPGGNRFGVWRPKG